MEKTFLKSFYVAGFTFYLGSYVFSELSIGTILEMLPDEHNSHDDCAVELRFKDQKIGYIPRDQNREISGLLKAGHNIFEVVVQQLTPEVYPERQVRVAVFIVSNKGKKK